MVNIQLLLDEGLFTASYKFALLLALADLTNAAVNSDVIYRLEQNGGACPACRDGRQAGATAASLYSGIRV
jgi:hypothetical protein